jgi:4-hydroxy-tetrahydrodipicolinate reductase
MALRICLAGATGWAGSELARGIAHAPDLTLTAAVSRTHAGRVLGEVLGEPGLTGRIYGSAAEALAEPCDVFVEYTHPASAKANILTALAHGLPVVVGTSGLTEADYAEIDAAAQAQGRGVLACGNFALTAVLLQKFAAIAARLIPQWEIVEYAQDTKPDAPSGTVRELALRLAQVRRPEMTVPLEDTIGPRESRGATVSGSQVHAVRLPGHVIGVDVIFGMPDQRLVLHHEAGASAQPYVAGALLAIRKVSTLSGLHRGLDSVLDL